MKKKTQNPDDSVIYVPDEILRNIDQALESMERAQKEFLRMAEEKKGEPPKKNQQDKRPENG